MDSESSATIATGGGSEPRRGDGQVAEGVRGGAGWAIRWGGTVDRRNLTWPKIFVCMYVMQAV